MLIVFVSETEHILFPQYHDIKQVSVSTFITQVLSVAALPENTLIDGFRKNFTCAVCIHRLIHLIPSLKLQSRQMRIKTFQSSSTDCIKSRLSLEK